MPSFTYNNAIPGPNDLLSQSQSDIQVNFASIQSLVDIDHVDFANANAGKHQAVHYVTQAVLPTTVGAEMSIFCAPSVATGGGYSLFVQQQNKVAGANAIEFTGGVFAASGYTYLPSGIIMQWGTGTTVGGNLAIVFPKMFPANVFNIQGTAINTGAQISIIQALQASITTTGFTAQSNNTGAGANNTPFYWYAIGN